MGSHEHPGSTGTPAFSLSDAEQNELDLLANELIAESIPESEFASKRKRTRPSKEAVESSKEVVESSAPVAVQDSQPEAIQSLSIELDSSNDEDLDSEDDAEAATSEEESDGRLRFSDMGLPAEICAALQSSGYEYPTPIQAATIPAMAAGRDVLGQAQTGTGKTAAFALPLLSKIDTQNPATQVLVLTPTRELAIQVAESFQRYAQHMRGLRVCPIYGGQAYATQIHALQRGVHVVVGTPGRVMDHMRENRLRIDTLKCLVLDEADEMLRMGFVDDVQWILEHSPTEHQIALFSATMPGAIREIADKYLKNPHVVAFDSQQRTAETIRQRFVMVEHRSKFEAMVRILEAEEYDGMIIFVKTKLATLELADNLTKAGYPAVALNGDIPQAQRERTIDQLKQGVFNILVATDVAARGLDVQRISHVINYDLPVDSEAYVHRIGRTGRAGRSGEAIVFIAPRQRGFLREIDRAAGQMIQPMAIPSSREINLMRTERFKSRIVKTCVENTTPSEQFQLFESLIEECLAESGHSANKIATALAVILQGDKPFLVQEPQGRSGRREVFGDETSARREPQDRRRDKPGRDEPDRERRKERRGDSRSESTGAARSGSYEMERFRVEVGRAHGVRPGNLVGAIANEAGLEASTIGHISIFEDYSTVDLPAGMPREIFKVLGRAWVVGRQLRISKFSDHASQRPERKRKPRSVSAT
jgi:ATP-dependent RNA helicase DeaD